MYKKNYANSFTGNLLRLLKSPVLMRLYLLCLVVASHISVFAYGQHIRLTRANAKLIDVIKEIKKQSNYNFLYDVKALQEAPAIDIDIKGVSVAEAISECLKNTALQYTLQGKNIIISTKPASKTIQQRIVKGKITDEKGLPIPGVTISIKGQQGGAKSDENGLYQINLPKSGLTLVFAMIGFSTQERTVSTEESLNVILVESVSDLDEVVVVGYGTQKKENLTGAVSAIDADKDINWKPVGQVSVALQGTMPGVTVTQSNGQPGNDQGTIRIRGIGTLNDNDPLVLVDGVQMSINDIDANDIANVTVLKDAAASSIYGVRAANGVILVTTKRGLSGKPRINYNNYFGWQKATRMSEFLGAQDFMRLMNLTYINSGGSEVYSATDIAAYDDPNRNTDLYPDNDWAKLILTGSGAQQQHSISLAGGAENIKYRFSSNYFNQKGLITNMNFDRLTTRLNTDIKLTEKLTFNADLSVKLSKKVEPQDAGAGSSWYQFQSVNNSPLIVNQYSDGTWGSGIVRLQKEGGQYVDKDNLITGNFRADYKLLEHLTLSGLASVNYGIDYYSKHTKEMVYYDFFTDPHEVLNTSGTNSITKQYSNDWFRNFQGLANYERTIGKHAFKVLGGVSALSRRYDYLSGFRNYIPNAELEQIDAGAEDGQSASGTANEYALLSYFGRINYVFNDRYLLEANLRHDGSSRFADGQRWGSFPSFSVGWRLGEEDFIKKLNIFQELKLRGSWGKLGNDNTSSNYPYQATYSYASSYAFGGSLYTASRLTGLPSSALSWETSNMWNVGLDIVTLQNKLDVSFDYYVKNTNDILLQLPIPLTTGLSAPYVNAASVRNKGWEFNAVYRDQIGDDFRYSVGFNLADVNNKITDMKGGNYLVTSNDVTTAYYEGLPIGSFYGYQADGLFQSAEEVAAHATQTGATAAGDVRYKDQNDDGVINDSDRINIGNSIPRYTYAINLSANYKGFDFSALFQGVGEADIYVRNMEKAPTSNAGNFKALHLDSWTPENPNASFPRLSTGTQNYVSSSYWIKSGSYLRLKSVQLGYRLPSAWLEKKGVSGLRIFTSASNLFTLTSLSRDIDPESPNDNRYYPQVRTITFGLNLDL